VLKPPSTPSGYATAVNPEHYDHTQDPKIVAVVDKWLLFSGHICNKSSTWDHKVMVTVGRWSLFGGGR
jgi:hypothetical protein